MTHKMEIIAALHSFTIKYYPFKCLFSQWMCIYPNTHICMITSRIALYSMYEALALCYLTLCLRLPFLDCNLLDILPYVQRKKNVFLSLSIYSATLKQKVMNRETYRKHGLFLVKFRSTKCIYIECYSFFFLLLCFVLAICQETFVYAIWWWIVDEAGGQERFICICIC